MNTNRPCGCKGYRTCLWCEKEYNLTYNAELNKELDSYVYCPECNEAWPGWSIEEINKHPNHIGTPIEYPGVHIENDFISKEEESLLIEGIDNELEWTLSQSGRRKQNFGPKCNFKKRKITLGNFKGFPKFTEFVQKKFHNVDILRDYQTIEQCSLEYDPAKGASIDPHVDDCWIWGERIITVNLLADSALTMTINSKPTAYNLDCVEKYPSIVERNGKHFQFHGNHKQIIVRIPMPRRSLLVLYDSARYEWEHQVLREDITARRVCLAYREFTPPYLEDGDEFVNSKDVLQKAQLFY